MNTTDGVSLTPEYSKAKSDFELLRESLLNTEEEREYLVHQVMPNLQAVYLSKVGKLKLELLELRMEVYRLKRKMELIQSCINRQSEIIIDVIDLLVEEEIKIQKKKLEEESKKLEAALQFIKQPLMNEDEAIELRSLYYKLARILHPDLNPEQSETMKTLWLKVSACYRQGDLAQLKLLEILSQLEIKSDSTPTLLEELKRRNELFSSRITKLLEEIEHIKNNFPFTYIERLDDPTWVTDENNDSLNAIAKTMDEKVQYEKAIETLLNGEGV